MADKKSKGQELAEKLTWSYPNIAQTKDAADQKKKAAAFCEGYKKFIGTAKTERECVNEAEIRLIEAGYQRFDVEKKYEPGDKV